MRDARGCCATCLQAALLVSLRLLVVALSLLLAGRLLALQGGGLSRGDAAGYAHRLART